MPRRAQAEVVELEWRHERREIVDVLASAFLDNTSMRFLCRGSGERYARSVRIWQEASAKVSADAGHTLLGVRHAGRLVGVACLEEPGRPVAVSALRRQLVRLAFRRPAVAWRTLRYFEAAASLGVDAPVAILHLIGVRSSMQGHGVGRALLEEVLRRTATHRSVPSPCGVYLLTDSTGNVSLYRRHGYELAGTARVGELTVYAMLRPLAA